VHNSAARQRNLQAVCGWITRQGFVNTSVSRIGEGGSVTAPALYYHGGSKEGVSQAVVEDAVGLEGWRTSIDGQWLLAPGCGRSCARSSTCTSALFPSTPWFLAFGGRTRHC